MKNNYLASRPRYEILDGLRGVAAILVVAFHLFETYSPGVVYQIINHGYLAVDFFFALSGFVIGYAYDERLASGQMTASDFLKRRFIRLHPLVCMGAVIGFLLFYFGGGPDFAISLFCVAIAMAWASYRLYDVPVREWLKNKWFNSVFAKM